MKRALPVPERAFGWVHDRLPPTLQGRVQLGTSHLLVVAVLVAVALAAAAWFLVRADPAGTVVAAPARPARTAAPSPLVPLATSPDASASTAVVAGAAGPGTGSGPGPAGSAAPAGAVGPSAAAGSAGPSGVIVVDVAGKVRHPGIATLPTGSRVVDAIEAAGGARRRVDLSSLNLARVLVDGEQVLVGLPQPTGVAAPAASAAGTGGASSTDVPLVNLNSADQTQLESLPGVGPVTAAAILKWREEHGAFASVDQLLEVSGIGDATLAEIAPFVTL